MPEVTTLTLSEFLLARITEDRIAAEWDHANDPGFSHEPKNRRKVARMFAECEAKRRIVKVHSDVRGWSENQHICAMCYDGDDVFKEDAEYPCLTLRLLALPYADHSDYDEEWKP